MMIFETPDLSSVTTAFGLQAVEVTPIQQGLVNHSYRVSTVDDREYFLQRINTRVFTNPIALQENYVEIARVMQDHFQVPAIIKTTASALLFQYNGHYWRCFEYLTNGFAPGKITSTDQSYQMAYCFGRYSKLLEISGSRLKTILPGFHDLGLRLDQLEGSIKTASPGRLQKARKLLERRERFAWIQQLYQEWKQSPANFPWRTMHHDCKISNLLFDKFSLEVLTPIDLDTTQGGLFFSDAGDMIRSVVPAFDEHTVVQEMPIRQDHFEAILNGCRDATGDKFTQAEKENLPFSGHLLLFMQATRFLTDYLNNDCYYHTSYPEQNFDRAANQFLALEAINRYFPHPFAKLQPR